MYLAKYSLERKIVQIKPAEKCETQHYVQYTFSVGLTVFKVIKQALLQLHFQTFILNNHEQNMTAVNKKKIKQKKVLIDFRLC
jgi:Fe-S cluster biosynthesis and repair protein YggX